MCLILVWVVVFVYGNRCLVIYGDLLPRRQHGRKTDHYLYARLDFRIAIVVVNALGHGVAGRPDYKHEIIYFKIGRV